MAKPDISIVVCTYERPDNLRRVLASIEGQRGVDGKFEVIVADDGSQGETEAVFQQFRRRANFRARFVTHPHRGFCPGRCRNEGVAASDAAYVLLLDGDCLIPPDHVRIHLERRRPSVVQMGDCVRLSEEISRGVTEETARTGAFAALVPWGQRARLQRKAWSAWWHNLRRHPWKPVLIGNNLGLWRDDYCRVNGFDENYVGWGCEDDDFGRRLRRAGIARKSILWWTHSYHLWHPPHPSAPTRWRDGPNVEYFLRDYRLTKCGNGLVKRTPQEISLQLIGAAPRTDISRRVIPAWCRLLQPNDPRTPEVEVLFAPSTHAFTGRADCNLLVIPDGDTHFASNHAQAHLIVTDRAFPEIDPKRQFALDEFEMALGFLLTNQRPAAIAKRLAA